LETLLGRNYVDSYSLFVTRWFKANVRLEREWPTLGITLLCVGYVPFCFESLENRPIEERSAELNHLLELVAQEPFILTDNFLNCIPHVLDIVDREMQSPVVEGWIECGTITQIVSPVKHGKTSFATAMGDAVVHGRPFLELPTTQRDVIYLDRENPHFINQERFTRHHIERCDAFRYLDMNNCEGGVPDPWSDAIVNYIQRTTPKPLLIIDAYRAFLQGDENSS